MNSTEARIAALQLRVTRNCHMLEYGALPLERQMIKREATKPLIGLAFIAGLICGGGNGLWVLRVPLVREAFHTMGTFFEDLA